VLTQVIQYSLDYNRSLPRVTAVSKYSVWDKVVADAEGWVIMAGGWEDDEVPLVKLLIRERDQTVMA